MKNQQTSPVTETIAPVKEKKLSENIFIVLIMFIVMMIAGSVVGAIIVSPLMFICSENIFWILANYLTFIGIHIIVLLYTFFTNREIFHLYFGKLKGNNWYMLLIGLVVGFLMNGSCILIAWLHGDVHFMPGNMTTIAFVVAFITVFIQSAAEELICRGYLYFHVKNRYGVIPSLLLSSLIFAVLHIGNSGATPLAIINIALIGVFFAFCVHYLDSLWMAMAIHATWNFTQNFIFGLPNSGLLSPISILKLEAVNSSPVYDPGFGVEGTFSAVVLLLLASVLLAWIGNWREKLKVKND